jgi:hypothetical protein
MSTGLPVLATRSGGPDSIIPGYAGILVDCESVPAVFVGLLNMYTRYAEFLPGKIRQYAIKSFGESVIMKCYKLVLDNVLDQVSDRTAREISDLSSESNSKQSFEKIPKEESEAIPV